MFKFSHFTLCVATFALFADIGSGARRRFNIDVPVDSGEKGIGDYVEWWQNILGLTSAAEEEADDSIQPVKLEDCPACDCGIARRTRIVGGQHVVYVNEYPWIAQLMYKGKFYCGGSLINSKYILTAAHCVHQFNKKYITVRLLEHDRRTSNESTVVDKKVAKLIKHKGYNVANFNNDIALVKLDSDVKLGTRYENPSAVCLPPEGKAFHGQDGIVVGWGATKAGGSSSQVLQQVTVPIMSNDECKKTKYGSSRITPNMMCAGHPDGGKDSCQGDSGGPLHIINNAYHQVAGVVSWGEGCAEKNYPGVYTRVNRYLNWIHNNTMDACPCPYTTTRKSHRKFGARW